MDPRLLVHEPATSSLERRLSIDNKEHFVLAGLVLAIRTFLGYGVNGGGVKAFDCTHASRKSSRFGETKAPIIPGLSTRYRTTVLTMASVSAIGWLISVPGCQRPWMILDLV